jgi:hypothetical protein
MLRKHGFKKPAMAYPVRFMQPVWKFTKTSVRTCMKKKVVSLERGPLSLVSTTEELLDRKVAAPV